MFLKQIYIITVCSTPPPIKHGYISGPNQPIIGSKYNYKCDSGYILKRSSSTFVECTEDGTLNWQYDNNPVCIPS